MATCNDSNGSNFEYAVKHYYLPVMYSIIFTVGVLGNLISLIVYLAKVRPWRTSSIIMVNLASTDLLYMLTMPFLVYYYSLKAWTLGEFMCQLVRLGFHFNLYASVFFLTCLAVFRYVAIVHPTQAARVQKRRWGILACVLTWSVAVSLMVPIFIMDFTVQVDNVTHCLDLASNDFQKVWWYSWMLTAIGFLLPLVIVCVCYARIATVLAQGPHIQRSHRVRARKLIAFIIICFVVCFLPFHVLRALRIYTNNDDFCTIKQWVHAAYIMSRPVAVLNIVFNLGLYTLAGDRFKQRFRSLFLPRKGDQRNQ
ncbi:2-oxoglutarate receptor 1-like [Trichomycterus rosablanca]|uniref:2-oxoglutarate receptor 1-like n=1 Tax=Trichomycterus rosablanca TaxID=2290929 RepID=UPI002F35AE3B